MTGMRVGEICGLKLGSVNARTKTIHVAATVVDGEYQDHTKSHKSRNVSIGSQLLASIQQYVEDIHEALGLKPTRDTPLLTIDGTHVSPSTIDWQWNVMRMEMGIPKSRQTTFHCLRHNHATTLLSSGNDMSAVKSRLGHARITTTDENYHYALPGYDESLAAEMESEWESY
jgi:integrase